VQIAKSRNLPPRDDLAYEIRPRILADFSEISGLPKHVQEQLGKDLPSQGNACHDKIPKLSD
jgi:hypothetical protein